MSQQAMNTRLQQALSSKVPFTASNVTKCMCPRCPVQGKSQCVSGKMSAIQKSLKSPTLKREDIPGEYCATGTASCDDIDTKQSCMCGACPVFSQYKLDKGQPAGYFCRDGMAR